jgi:hypothetical protein
MSLNLKLSETTVNAEADAHSALLNSGYLRIYDGTQPTNADTAIGTQVLLAELRFSATAFAAASGGVATANAITSDSSANASGTATWYRTLKSDGTTVVSEGSVGTSGANLNLNSVAISAGAAVDCTAFVFTQPKS